MYKLSRIELENFRVFKGNKPFDFLNRAHKPYNFICIYGPNGSGKTAFVDAFEWLANGKLHRIESDMQVQKKTYMGAILTHLEAYEKSQWANVTAHFIDSNGSTPLQYRRSVRPRRDSVNDYLSGSCSGGGLSYRQILPHSRVAGFVSAAKPEQRFDNWAGFIDPEDQSFSLLTNTYRLRSRIKSVFNNLEEELGRVTEDVSNCSLGVELVSILNNTISSCNEAYCEIYPQEKPIVTLQQNESGIYLIPDLSNIKAIHLRVSGELERFRTREPILRHLIDGYPVYQKTEVDLVNINELGKAYQEKIEKIQQKKEIDALKRNVNSLYDTLTYLLEECTEDINEQIRLVIEQKEEFKKEQNIWRQQLKQIEKEAADLNKFDPNSAYQDAVERKKMLQSSLQSLAQISAAIESQEFEVASTNAATLPQEYHQEIIEKVRQLIEQNDAIQSMVKQRTQISLHIQEAESSCNEVIASIEQIRAQIINEQFNACPVCQTEFTSTESLLARIKQEFCSKDLADARAEHHANGELLKSFRNSYKNMVQSWEFTKQNISKKLEEELSALNKKIDQFSVSVEQFNLGFSLLEERRQIIKKQLNTSIDFTGELTLDVFDLFIENAYQRFNEIHRQKLSIKEQLSTFSVRLQAVMMCLSGEVTDAQRQLETALNFLPAQYGKIDTLKESAQEYISKVDQLVAKREMLPNLSEVNSDELQTYQTKLSDLVAQQTTLKSVIENYKNFLLKAQLAQQTTIEQINQQFSNEQKIKDILEIKILPSLINILSHETELLAYQNQYQNVIHKKSETEERLKATKRAFERIDILYNSIRSMQQKMVDQVFAGEKVNQLYRLLEPNKDFPQLSFKIDFNSAERPELYITAHDKKENDSIVLPELIFSTAQLNTISLCIFLSNALSSQRLDSQTLIFDDPISSFDDINTVAFCDLLRILCVQNDWQILFTTHDEKLFRLLQVKLSPKYHNSLFMEFKDKGQLVDILHSI